MYSVRARGTHYRSSSRHPLSHNLRTLLQQHLHTVFKKPLSNLKTSAPFRGSDRRKLKQRVIVAYNVSPEIGDILVPERLISQKFATNT
ncbi:hypothetical protein EDC04DRAFT_2831662, partial [Pisolithus marmoratus]